MKIGEIMERVDNRHKELWDEYTSQGLKMGFARFLVTGLVIADNYKQEKDTELATANAALQAQSKEIAQQRSSLRQILSTLNSGAITTEAKLRGIRELVTKALESSKEAASGESGNEEKHDPTTSQQWYDDVKGSGE